MRAMCVQCLESQQILYINAFMYRNNNESLHGVITLFSFRCTMAGTKKKKYFDAGIISDCPYGLLKQNERKHIAMSINACMVHYISSAHHYYNVTTKPIQNVFCEVLPNKLIRKDTLLTLYSKLLNIFSKERRKIG